MAVNSSPEFGQPDLWAWPDSPMPDESASEIRQDDEQSIEQLLPLHPDNMPDWYLHEALRLFGERNTRMGIVDAVSHGKCLDDKTMHESREMAAAAEATAKQMAADARHMFELAKGDAYPADQDRDWRIGSAYYYFSQDFGGVGEAYELRRQNMLRKLERRIRARSMASHN